MKILISNIIFFVCFQSISQNFIVHSNINPFLLKPKWINGFLETKHFRDGTELNIVSDLKNWGLNNNPSVFISKKNEYLYNYNALIDNKELCPFGYKVPSYNDLENSIIQIDNYIIYNNEISNKNIITSYPYINHFVDEYLFLTPRTEIYLATTTANESIYEFTSAIVNIKSKFLEEWPLPKNSALGVKCVEDFNESLLNKEFEYRQLLPQDYENLISKISNILINSNCPSFNFKGNLKFNSNGLNVSDSFSKIDKETNLNLYNNVKNTISNWKTYPFYNDVKVKCFQ